MTFAYNTILYTHNHGVTTIALNRPESYNAFTGEMRSELLHALQSANDDIHCRVVVLTGSGKAFCSGQDLKDIAGVKVDFNDFLKNGYNPIILAMRNMPKPIIGRINGVAAGAGCSLALACDYIIADNNARLVEVFVGIGLVLDSGSSYFLPRVIGTNRAFELATMGTKLSATDAVSWGMINKAVPSEELDQAVLTAANYYANAPTKAIGMIKNMLNNSNNTSLEKALDYEAYCQDIAGNTQDYAEGVAAFLEKRKPIFKGK
jgi:2-(1,2-epoxy-1,2-dihydrophenyl)acetyl-CoA isomerase